MVSGVAINIPMGPKMYPKNIMDMKTTIFPYGAPELSFLVAALTAKYRITTAMLAGCLLSIIAFVLIGATNAAWMIVLAIAMFSFGEMMISPKKNEFMGNIAPKGKKAMYLGFSQIPLAVGWTLEGFLGPWLYGVYASNSAAQVSTSL